MSRLSHLGLAIVMSLVGFGCTGSSTPTAVGAVENDAILLMDANGLIVEQNSNADGQYIRIQNYTSNADGYVMKEGEYFIEVLSGGQAPDESGFKTEFTTTEPVELFGKQILYGKERQPVGDSPKLGIGYLKTTGTRTEIRVLADTASGIEAGTSLVSQIRFKD